MYCVNGGVAGACSGSPPQNREGNQMPSVQLVPAGGGEGGGREGVRVSM